MQLLFVPVFTFRYMKTEFGGEVVDSCCEDGRDSDVLQQIKQTGLASAAELSELEKKPVVVCVAAP